MTLSKTYPGKRKADEGSFRAWYLPPGNARLPKGELMETDPGVILVRASVAVSLPEGSFCESLAVPSPEGVALFETDVPPPSDMFPRNESF